MKLPQGATSVITGAGSGLGRAFALELGRRAGRVVVSDIDLEAAEETARLVREAGGQSWAFACDVRQWEQVEALAREAREAAGEIDLLINNAGVAVGGLVGEVPLEDWRWAIDINLWGVIHGCQAFVPAMRARRRGWILNVASSAGFVCLPKFAPYSVSKAGVIALSETLHAEVGPLGIDVSVLCPTFFQTNIARDARGDGEDVRQMAIDMMKVASMDAGDVARRALESLERGQLYALPMLDGHAAWVAKRVAPSLFHRIIGPIQKRAAAAAAKRAARKP